MEKMCLLICFFFLSFSQALHSHNQHNQFGYAGRSNVASFMLDGWHAKCYLPSKVG